MAKKNPFLDQFLDPENDIMGLRGTILEMQPGNIFYSEHFFRVLLILWGTNKFLKKLIKPKAVNNNELADFISRVPDNEELVFILR